MAKNQLSAIQRYQLQEWLHKQAKLPTPFYGLAKATDIAFRAATDLQLPIVPAHIRSNMKMMGLWVVGTSIKKTNVIEGKKKQICNEFTCECGKKYRFIMYEKKRG